MRTRRTRPLLAISAAVLVSWGTRSVARADEDYDPHSNAWNGLGALVRLTRDSGITVELPGRVDVGTLRPDDALLIVYPAGPLPVEGLSAFLKAGGRVALADDFGAGNELLSAYQIARGAPNTQHALQLRGNPALLVARPRTAHPLAEGVHALVTNHPTDLFHRNLDAIFSFDDDGREALVLAGAVGQGRLVAVADPSVLIDNMLELRDNRRFAQNLVRYLAEGRGGRIVIASGHTPIVGRFGEPGADRPLHDVRRALEQLAAAPLPPLALQLGCAALAALALLFAATSLPRKTPYDGRGMFARAPHAGGYVGRVAFFAESHGNLLMPALVYKHELEGEIVRRMGLTGQTPLRDVLVGLRGRGLGESDVVEARALLVLLDDLKMREDRPPAPPRVTEAALHEIVARGERLLARLPGART